jgi:hypothetical protein
MLDSVPLAHCSVLLPVTVAGDLLPGAACSSAASVHQRGSGNCVQSAADVQDVAGSSAQQATCTST